jgi:hypothetical protein
MAHNWIYATYTRSQSVFLPKMTMEQIDAYFVYILAGSISE